MAHKEYYIERTERKGNDLEKFNKLCDRAKEIILNASNMDCGYYYFYIWGIDDELTSLSPIEQIFYISNGLYELGNIEKDFRIDISPQIYIQAKTKLIVVIFLLKQLLKGMRNFS